MWTMEIKKLMKVCELTRYAERNRLIVSLSMLSGMRACEIADSTYIPMI